MSNRTIIEINHDFAHRIREAQAPLAELLFLALAGSRNENWEPLERLGIKKIVMTHHSVDRKVVVEGKEYPVG